MKGKDLKREKAKELYLKDKTMTNKEIANILGVPNDKIATWKYRDKWDRGEPQEPKKEVIKEDKDFEYIDETGLTDKQKLFCCYYIENFNAYQSAIKAGYSDGYARTHIYSLLSNPKVGKYLDKIKAERMERVLINGDDIVRRHIKIAFSDLRDFVNTDGTLKENIDGSLIKKINIRSSVIEMDNGSKTNNSISIELEDRKESLKFLSEYMNVDPKTELAKRKYDLEKAKARLEQNTAERKLERYIELLSEALRKESEEDDKNI